MKLKKCLATFALTFMMVLSSVSFAVSASSTTTADADAALKALVSAGALSTTSAVDATYTYSGGGTASYTDLVDSNGLVNSNYQKLTSSSKQKLLTDMIAVADNAVESDGMIGGVKTDIISEETKATWLNQLQSTNGVGTQLMTVLLQNTKPDFVGANRIYAPFSGPVGIGLGLGAILIMLGVSITMVLDLCYIAIPAFRMFADGDNTSGNGSKPKFISHEAVSAVQLAEDGGGTGGQNGGGNKVAVGLYFKRRVWMLIILGVCLLYLVSGNIFVLVGWFLDLVSGFLGF